MSFKLRIILEYFQPKIGRRIRIFSLGRKNNILILKKSVRGLRFQGLCFHRFLDTLEKGKQAPRVNCFHQMCRTYIRLVISRSEFSTSAVCGLCFRGLCSRHPPSETKQSNMLGRIKDLKTADRYL